MPTNKSLKRTSRNQSKQEVLNSSEVETKSIQELPQKKNKSINKVRLVLAAVILVAAIGVYLLKNQLIVATVNGRIITRFELIKQLEKQYGKQTLDMMVTESIVRQEAAKKGLTISDDEINTEIKNYEDYFTGQSQSLDEVLGNEGLSRQDLRKQIELKKFVEKLVAEKVTVTDEEVSEYVKNNTQYFAENLTEDQKKEQAKKDLTQEKINQEGQTLIDSLKKTASVSQYLKF